MAITWITPTEVTVGAAGAWTDVDLSALIPSGSTGVMFHVVNIGAAFYAFGARKNGSTDNLTSIILNSYHTWGAIGCDGSRITEFYVGDTTAIDIYIVGYFGDETVFFDNAVDKSLTATAAWTDIDISGDTGANTAIGAIFEVNAASTAQAFGLRMNGSIDARIGTTTRHHAFGAIVGVDGSEICEGYIASIEVDFFLVGYIKSGATFLTNATDLSLSTTGAWTDLSALPADAVGAFIEIDSGTSVLSHGLRKNGSAEDIYLDDKGHSFAFVECDASQIIEGKIETIAKDFFLVGYVTAAAGGTAVPVFMHHLNMMAQGA